MTINEAMKKYRLPNPTTTEDLEMRFSGMDGKTLTPEATYICKSMLSIARNIDLQNNKGREISRNMTSLLTWFQELKSMYPDQPQLDPTLTDFISDAKAGL